MPFELNATSTALVPRVRPVTLGAFGWVAATNELEALDDALSPMPLVATTAHV